MRPVIEFVDVKYAYPNGPPSLQGISFYVEKGKKIALVGPNGAGKTTLLLMCNGILRPASGSVRINGTDLLYDNQSLRDVRKKVGFVFQNSDNQIFAPTVYQDVAFGPLNLGMENDVIRDVVTKTLFSVGLCGYEKRPPHHLSGGEKKRVAIAGVLAMEPDVLVFDEPTSSLDPASAAEIMDLLDELNDKGTTILVSTHDVELAYGWADEVILIAEGSILHHGAPESVFTDQVLMKKARLTLPPVLELYMELVARGILEENTPPGGILEMVGQVERAFGTARGTTRPGRIYLCNPDSVDVPLLKQSINDGTIRHVGAMGTRAKMFAEKEGIVLTFTYGVIDKCILKAFVGEDTLIITTGGMLSRVTERVGRCAGESRINIPVLSLGDDEKTV
jgi:cobalt/nickel transport system ATP-binding protein